MRTPIGCLDVLSPILFHPRPAVRLGLARSTTSHQLRTIRSGSKSGSPKPLPREQNTTYRDALIEDITQTENRDAIYLPDPDPDFVEPEKRDAAYWTALNQKITETRRKLEEEVARMPPKYPKEYHEIAESLDDYCIKPNAPWGFVIFRAVYGAESDIPFARISKLLRTTIADVLTSEDQPELLPRHELTVMENEATLAGADSHTVRECFRAWVADDLTPLLVDEELERYGGVEQVRAKLASNDAYHDGRHPVACLPPRWKFCILVDDDCLRSLDSKTTSGPVVKLLTTEWFDGRPGAPTEDWTEDWDGGETDHEFEDVGWMYMEVDDYVTMYRNLTDSHGWNDYYERPLKCYIDR